jgi:hypothetical protein
MKTCMPDVSDQNARADVSGRCGTSPLAAIAVFTLVATLFTGCGQSGPQHATVYPVKGKVELNGKPTPGAVVVLHPKGNPEIPSARAEVQADGTFVVGTYGVNDGAAEGDYVATVEWFKAVPKNDDYVVGPNLVPKQYSAPQTSKLEVHVAAQPNQLPTFKLKR